MSENEIKEVPRSQIGWYLLAAITPAVIAFLFLHFINSSQNHQESYTSYREACLSGNFHSLRELHQFVREELTTVEGELAKEEFLNTYYWKAKPVLMKGAAKHWQAYSQWTDEYLQNNFFDMKFYVDLRKHHSTSKPVRTKMNLGKFLRNYKDKEWYLDSMTVDDRFLDEMIVPKYLNFTGIFESNEESEMDFYQNFYLSSGNTNSPLHCDGYANLLTVLDGTKEWILADAQETLKLQMDEWIDFPNLSPLNVTNFTVSDHPGLCDVRWYRAVVEAGDTLFVPLLHPHHVYSPPGRNMAVGMWFYLESYNRLLEAAQFHDIDPRNMTGTVAVYRDHVTTRPAPCEVTDCTPLEAGSLRTKVQGQTEQHSRNTDVPPPSHYPLSLWNNASSSVPGIAYGTGLPGGSIDNVYVNTISALNMGYKFIDTAVMYGNEKQIGEAVRDCRWLRSSVVVLTKIMWSHLAGEDLEIETTSEIEGSLERLDVEYIDILLIHDTEDIPDMTQLTVVWKALESFVLRGKVRALGLSNADMSHVKHVESIASVPISLIQNIFTPLDYDKELYSYCLEKKILFMGYGITGDVYVKGGATHNPVLKETAVSELAELYETTQHSVLYNWAARKEVIVTSRSTRLKHMKENHEEYQNVYLNSDHMTLLDDLFAGGRGTERYRQIFSGVDMIDDEDE